MITTTLLRLFDRDLDKLASEFTLYDNEEKIWLISDGIKNSAGNLCLHITGNLQYYIGAVLGGSGYVRNRNVEFSLKNVPVAKLHERIEDTKNIVRDTLEQISKKELEQLYPQVVLDEPTSTEYFLVHLLGHLNYHLGQINYHRRMIQI